MVPRVSAVIPTCDRPELLARALRSVMAQTVPPYEVIVVDNGAVPVERDALPRPAIMERLPPRIGASRARNAGAKRAEGDYVAFLDDDDEWDAAYLEHMLKAIRSREPRPDLLYGRKDLVIDGHAQPYKCITEQQLRLPALLIRNPGTGGTNCVARREPFLEQGGFDTNLVAAEDRSLAVDFILAGKALAAVPEAVALVHRGRDDHLTQGSTHLQGKRQFLRKYAHLMGWREWLTCHSTLMALRAERSREQERWSRPQEELSHLLKRLAARFPPLKQT